MASWQTRAVCLYLRATRKARYSTTERGLQALAKGIPPAAPPRTLEGRLFTEQVAGFEVSKVRPSASRSTMAGVLVYLHGGAFVNGIAKQHWDLVSFLADATGREVWVPRYGLAPAHGADDARAFLEAVHDRLRDDRAVHVLGDSAGGNLALLLAQAHTGDRSIVGLTLIAPWLDLSISNPQIDAVEPHDPWLSRAGLRPIAVQWAGEHGLQDPAVSPLLGDLTKLPPTEIFVGTETSACRTAASCATEPCPRGPSPCTRTWGRRTSTRCCRPRRAAAPGTPSSGTSSGRSPAAEALPGRRGADHASIGNVSGGHACSFK
ncbi:MAG TPA: alpha/beta fold hydrolase [Nocardioidaceae bacterium]|nr:alpha/beta fold hydrolase [Nocardioidaceae bacterium]